MVDRIEKIKPSEYWKIQETADAKKDKRGKSEEEKQQEQRSRFEEKTDFNRLIAKDRGKRETLNLMTRDIQSFVFRSLSTGRDQASLEADIHFKDGSKKEAALISIPRAESLKFMHHKPGDALPLDGFLAKDLYLRASVLVHPGLSHEEAAASPTTVPAGAAARERGLLEKPTNEALTLFQIVLLGVAILALLAALIGIIRFVI